MRRIAALVVVVIGCSAATHETNFKKLFNLEPEPGDFSGIAYLSSVLFLTICGEEIKMN